jgi:hypothetical protein
VGEAEAKYGTFPEHLPTAHNCKENQPVAPVSETTMFKKFNQHICETLNASSAI